MKNIILALMMLNLFSIGFATQAASFNCAAAQTKTEHAICEHRALNDADVKMATTYHIIRKLVPMGNGGAIQDQQLKWLSLRNQCQANLSCLSKAYQIRQQTLELNMSRIYQQGPF